jgi:hypothetical protein
MATMTYADPALAVLSAAEATGSSERAPPPPQPLAIADNPIPIQQTATDSFISYAPV